MSSCWLCGYTIHKKDTWITRIIIKGKRHRVHVGCLEQREAARKKQEELFKKL